MNVLRTKKRFKNSTHVQVGCMISQQYHRIELQDSSINRLIIETYNKEEKTCKIHFDLSTPPVLYRIIEQEAVTQPNGVR